MAGFPMADDDPKPDSLPARLDRAERELLLLRALLDLVPDFFYVHDPDIRYVYANRAAADYFGVPKESLVGRLLTEVEADPEQGRFYTELCQKILAEGRPRLTDELPLRVRDGTMRYLRQHDIPFTDPTTGARMLAGISRDITADRQAAEERLLRERAERELEVAREVQRSLLPGEPLRVAGYEVAGACVPSYFAAGDFYDWFPCRGGGAIVLGDATGHGIGPALLATACKAYTRATLPGSGDLASAVGVLNRLLEPDLSGGRFVTLAAVTLGDGEGVRFVSAGHGPVLLLRHGCPAELLATHGPPLGVAPELPFDPATELSLSPGDSLLLLSDGLHEAFSPAGEQFGMQRLCSAAESGRHLAPGELAQNLIRSALDHGGSASPADDMTVVVIRR
jgi:PAS domain S-box-containing protein